jgi:hypothetical protein
MFFRCFGYVFVGDEPRDMHKNYITEILDTLNSIQAKLAGTPDEQNNRRRPPLADDAKAVLEILEALPERDGLQGKELLIKVEKEKNVVIRHDELTKRIIPKLRPYGVDNEPGAGYYKK